MLRKTSGIILRRKALGEADVILTIYTLDLGKIRVRAKGIKKITSRRAGHLEPLMISHLELRKDKNHNYLIYEVKNLITLKKLRGNFSRTIIGCYFAELLDQTTYLEEKNTDIFNLLKESLILLEQVRKAELPALIYSYKIKFINLLGFKPELDYCLSCGKKPLDQKVYFSFFEGGIFCSSCSPHDSKAMEISINMLKTLRALELSSLKDSLSIKPPEIEKIGNLVDFYIKFILEKDLESKKIIKNIKKDQIINEIKSKDKIAKRAEKD